MVSSLARTLRLFAVVALFATLLAATPSSAAVPDKPFTSTGCDAYSDSVARLYTAGLGRQPEQGGFEFWLVEYTFGRWDLPRMATFFSQSPEFAESYGDPTNREFVEIMYRNVLDREGEPGGVEFWTGELDTGQRDRATVLLNFAESPENITNSGTTQPALGPFNAGLTDPWTCTGWTPPDPGDTRNCSDFTTQAEAQAWFDYYHPAYGDIAKLDFDNNLVPCESLP